MVMTQGRTRPRRDRPLRDQSAARALAGSVASQSPNRTRNKSGSSAAFVRTALRAKSRQSRTSETNGDGLLSSETVSRSATSTRTRQGKEGESARGGRAERGQKHARKDTHSIVMVFFFVDSSFEH